ncbi:hypothetical protein AVEN_136295-1 [Araneus ventricosus]|uniref:Uncharacterized protein n=1 Tax=Araneus ventricosus TaxID=182803 RepID=A0A4Y2V916_ARAVE|nr:hypothetical protein AVEN_136295-1 [Araneus ventricosus]
MKYLVLSGTLENIRNGSDVTACDVGKRAFLVGGGGQTGFQLVFRGLKFNEGGERFFQLVRGLQERWLEEGEDNHVWMKQGPRKMDGSKAIDWKQDEASRKGREPRDLSQFEGDALQGPPGHRFKVVRGLVLSLAHVTHTTSNTINTNPTLLGW